MYAYLTFRMPQANDIGPHQLMNNFIWARSNVIFQIVISVVQNRCSRQQAEPSTELTQKRSNWGITA